MPSQKPSSGYLFVNKTPGLTSSDVVIRLKKKFHLDSIGHTGTLDRFAEGLLILPFGDYTAFSQLFLGEDKTYYAEVELGKKTDSGDLDGVVSEKWTEEQTSNRKKELHWSAQFLVQELAELLGWKVQKAPKISALKVDGKRQSDQVRSGKDVKEKERPIRIERVWDVSFSEDRFCFRIHVSSGTYIRKIVLDLAEKWGLPLVLTRLVRESIGKWTLLGAKTYMETEIQDAKRWQDVLVLPARRVNADEKKAVIHGGYVWDKLPKADETGFYFLEEGTDEIVAWCVYQGRSSHLPYRYSKVFFNPTAKIMFSI
ncbi:tRNA pseudouridine(55) synthase TruB [Leptospira ognonensis]|uniref:tRNA pseudouridine synthase B n=1 Tax=Leptospira ognonensis TaxID=2484945 RepID=A0A4R9KA55_9LEPT|nr:tRNA pseudouridine(55) synthase TruB [Leptospira ognonensis]TGL62694.1 tRNA pseudouridine(55) synthase TruB [Leptospira ognonensis]